ncbi:MAG: hypothetical protein ACU83V_13700 [Gammaproteobacteria bacterium]
MNENQKSLLFGAAGILVGVLVSVIGVNELNSRFMSAAEDIGKTRVELDQERNKLADIKKGNDESLTDLTAQKKKLSEISAQLDTMLENLTKLQGPGAENKIKLIQQLFNTASNPDAVQRLVSVEEKINALRSKYEPNIKWPHAINCGNAWDALYVLHGAPKDASGPAWYVQVYPSEYRYVRFNPDTSYLDFGGHSQSSEGCHGKSIDVLKAEGRTYQFMKTSS